jgi:hypothetical protein
MSGALYKRSSSSRSSTVCSRRAPMSWVLRLTSAAILASSWVVGPLDRHGLGGEQRRVLAGPEPGRVRHCRRRRDRHRPAALGEQRLGDVPHERRIFTSNKHPDDWGAVLHDDDLAAAILDRILERGRLLHLDGPSMRTKHLGLDAPALHDRQPSAASSAIQPQRGRSQGREAQRRDDEGSLHTQAERRPPPHECSPGAAAQDEDLGAPARHVARSSLVARISGIRTPEFPEPTGIDRRAVGSAGATCGVAAQPHGTGARGDGSSRLS